MAYRDKLKALLVPGERKLLARLSTPQKIQDYLHNTESGNWQDIPEEQTAET